MSKSIKFKNNNYLDSSSIVHNRELLKDSLNKISLTKTGTVTPSSSEKFQLIRNNVRQKGNVVFVDLTIKLLVDIPQYSQYLFEISGVDTCSIDIFPISSYSANDEWKVNAVLYTFCKYNSLWIANHQCANNSGDYWNVHFSYMVD